MLLLAAFGLVALLPATASAHGVVRTDKGPVQGVKTPAINKYLGIPFAAPPVGDLRWRPPQAPARWRQPRDATTFANHCPQHASPFGFESSTEDCLYLNVFTPSKKGRGRRRGRGHAERPARDGVAARRRPDRRRERRLRPDAPGGAGRDRRDGQLPPGLPRLPRASGAERRVRRPGLRQLRADGPAGGAALGASQHRAVRRRRRQGDDLRPVRRRPERAFPPRLAPLRRACSTARSRRAARIRPRCPRSRRRRRAARRPPHLRLSRPDHLVPASALRSRRSWPCSPRSRARSCRTSTGTC